MPTRDVLKLENQLCFALYAASRVLTQSYQSELSRFGLTYPQYLVLLVLWDGDGVSVKHLGERMLLDSGTLTPLLKRMEAQGLVRRTRSSRDERVVDVSLTPRGKRLKQQVVGIPRAMFAKAGLSLDEFTHLRETLRALTSKVQESITSDKQVA